MERREASNSPRVASRGRTGQLGQPQSEIPRHLQQGRGELADRAAAVRARRHEAGSARRSAVDQSEHDCDRRGASGRKKALNASWNAVRPDATRSYGEMARALTEQGAARDARIQSIIDALDRRQGNAELAAGAGQGTALLGAIAASAAARRHRETQD